MNLNLLKYFDQGLNVRIETIDEFILPKNTRICKDFPLTKCRCGRILMLILRQIDNEEDGENGGNEDNGEDDDSKEDFHCPNYSILCGEFLLITHFIVTIMLKCCAQNVSFH